MFVNINENFFINKKLTQKIKKCIIFVCNQKNSSKLKINSAYKFKNLKKLIFLLK